MENNVALAVFLRRVKLFAGLCPDEIQFVLERSTVKSLDKGEILCRKGHEPYFLYVIISGSAAESVADSNNFTADLREEGRYDYFGELGILLSEGYSSTVAAATKLEVLCIPKDVFLSLTSAHPDILITVIRTLKDRLQLAVQMEIGHTQMDAEMHLAYALMSFYKKSDFSKNNRVFTTQAQLAASCGIARQTASKILNRWKKANIIELQRGYITILQEEALTDIFMRPV